MKNKLLSLFALLLLLTGCPFLCGGCQSGADAASTTATVFAMDTYMTIRLPAGEEAVMEEVVALIEQSEARLSVTREDSEIYRLNHSGTATLSPDSARLLRQALALCAETDGALDLSIYPIVRAWGFTGGDYRVPAEQTIRDLLQTVDYTRIELDGDVATLPAGMEIDLGSVAKGDLGDAIARLLRENGIDSALLDLGGNIQTVGSRPDGTPWRVAIRLPQEDGLAGVVAVTDQAVVTSGGYERCFTDEQGRTWWHIMDPATGYPAANGLLSVTIVGDQGLRCDALSTALFVMGEERAVAFWRQHRDFDMLLINDRGEMLITPELAARFTAEPATAKVLQVIEDVAN